MFTLASKAIEVANKHRVDFGDIRIVEERGPSPIHRRSFSPVAIASQLKLFGKVDMLA